MAKNGARVYSYLRFSDPRQATGSSADRQLQYAQQWAASKGLVLDDTLSLRDEGLSALSDALIYPQNLLVRRELGADIVATVSSTTTALAATGSPLTLNAQTYGPGAPVARLAWAPTEPPPHR